MSLRSKEYVLEIAPIPWTRAGLNGKHFYDRQEHEKLSIGLLLNSQHGGEPEFQGPLAIDMVFHMKIPTLKAKRKAHGYHMVRPDIDNLIKLILDSINDCNSIWHDDAMVSMITAKKIYDGKPKTVIKISELT